MQKVKHIEHGEIWRGFLWIPFFKIDELEPQKKIITMKAYTFPKRTYMNIRIAGTNSKVVSFCSFNEENLIRLICDDEKDILIRDLNYKIVEGFYHHWKIICTLSEKEREELKLMLVL